MSDQLPEFNEQLPDFNEPEKRCPKCDGEMVQGFLIDRGPGPSGTAIQVAHWIEGPPKKSFWMGTKVDGNAIPIGTFCCSSCGFLESYAQRCFAAQ